MHLRLQLSWVEQCCLPFWVVSVCVVTECFTACLILSTTVLTWSNSSFNRRKFYILHTESLFPYYVTAFYRRDVKCLLRCTECVFVHNSVLTLVFRIGMGNTFFFLRVLLFSLVSNISPLFHTLLRLHVFLTRRKNGRILGKFQKPLCFSEVGEHLVAKSSGLVFKGSRSGIISPNTASYAGFICILTPGLCKHLVTLRRLTLWRRNFLLNFSTLCI
jgi:hypothetical protein